MSLESFKATNRMSSECKSASESKQKELNTSGLLRKLKPVEMRGTPTKEDKSRS